MNCERSTVDCRLLLVYGTLRRGFDRHDVLRRLNARYEGAATAQAELFDLGDYPGAKPSRDEHCHVEGELYRLPNPARALQVLDRVEGFREGNSSASLFRREVAQVVRRNGEVVSAWIYWLNHHSRTLRPVTSGDYAKR